MSDLANSCEYLSNDKLCALITNDPKAKTLRQINCENSQNIASCCYLCVFRSQCATSCKYLGQTEKPTKPQYVPENTYTNMPNKLKDNTSPLENVPVAFCFACNIDMAWTKTRFIIDHWRGSSSNMLVCDKALPVTVLLCPKCGKLEFNADVTNKEEVI
ncbi:MAG: hypothetical protein FWF66_07280 [Candidatus Bathyarchaeota archaeon]|nr:hypothetical protein [Candidatus Termiticorpusculum sp.]MCL1971235.1 hypothetical protein [Candidatus Termiticorpusculum sp.]